VAVDAAVTALAAALGQPVAAPGEEPV
jgi:hypothetical protein